MDTILRGTAATISATFYVDAAATDPVPDSATAEVLKDDGTTLVASTPATNAGTGKFTYTLAPAQTVDLDILTARWTATVGGQAQTVETNIEIVGAFLVSLAAIQGTVTQTKTADELAAARGWAETALEDACGVAFRPRYATQVISGDGGSELLLGWPELRSLVSATVSDTALTAPELAAVGLRPTGVLYNAAGWTKGTDNVAVAYTHGMRYCPARVSAAVLRLARAYLLTDPSDLDERATSITTEEATYALVTAGVRGAPFSIPEVNQVVEQYRFVSV